MREEREVWIEGTRYSVVISDEEEALLAADAAGRAVIGLWRRGCDPAAEEQAGPDTGQTERAEWQDLSPARYLVESAENLEPEYLERVVRRTFGIPWMIGETRRLIIREFETKDSRRVPPEPEDTEADRIFSRPDLLSEYIRCQYGFYEYGIWALMEKRSRQLVGKAGAADLEIDWSQWELTEEERGRQRRRDGMKTRAGKPRAGKPQTEKTPAEELPAGEPQTEKTQAEEPSAEEPERALELGYHIFMPFRNHGYASESCREIIRYMKLQFPCRIYAKIDASNEASIRVARSCGLKFIGRRYTGAGQWQYLYAEC